MYCDDVQASESDEECRITQKVSKAHHVPRNEGRTLEEISMEKRRNKHRKEKRKRMDSPSSEDSSYSSHTSDDERRERDWLRKSVDRGTRRSHGKYHNAQKSGWRRNSRRDGSERYVSSSSRSDVGRGRYSKKWRDSGPARDKRSCGARYNQESSYSSSDEESSESDAGALVQKGSTLKRALPESCRRRESRRKQTSMKKEASQRQSEGKKPFFVVVDSDTGEVYGNGLKNWKKEVKKISYSLDPSVVDVRRFPKEKLREAREKLAEKFEYSSKLSKGFFRSVLGRALSQRRNAVLALIESGVPCPLSFDERIWNTLKKYKDNPATLKKREDTQRARASRGSGGRTGPLGESGVRQRLAEMLGRSPDPEEVALEMKRDKGCAGRKRKALTLPKNDSNEARYCHA